MTQRRRRRVEPKSGTTLREPPNWKWSTLPVYIALTGGFVIGWYVAAAGALFRLQPWAQWVLFGGLALFSFGLSRVVSYYVALWMARRKAKSERQGKRILSDPTKTPKSGSSPR